FPGSIFLGAGFDFPRCLVSLSSGVAVAADEAMSVHRYESLLHAHEGLAPRILPDELPRPAPARWRGWSTATTPSGSPISRRSAGRPGSPLILISRTREGSAIGSMRS